MTRRTLHYAACGLEYVYLENVPVRKTAHGEVIDADLARIERQIAIEVVRHGVPIRGAEVQFLRKSLGLSLERFGKMLGLSAPAILKWERARGKRLEPTNEVGVRALMAEQLGIPLQGKFTVLKGTPDTPQRLSLQVASF
jgi:DNA-binding transcriptional regulator YiaG